jgi:chromosome segregation ATPase
MAERRPTTNKLIEEMIKLGTTPFNDGELETFVVQKARNLRGEIDMHRAFVTMLEDRQNRTQLKAEIEQLQTERNAQREKNQKDNENEVARIQAEHEQIRREAQEATQAFLRNLQQEKAEETNRIVQRHRAMQEQRERDIAAIDAELEAKKSRVNALTVDEVQAKRRLEALKAQEDATVKEKKETLSALMLQIEEARKTLSEMKREQESFLQKFGV